MFQSATYTLNSTTLALTYPANPQISIAVPFSAFGNVPSATSWIITSAWFQQVNAGGNVSIGLAYYMTYSTTNPTTSGAFGQTNATNEFFPSSAVVVSGNDSLQAYMAGTGAIFGLNATSSTTLTINFFMRVTSTTGSPALSATNTTPVIMSISSAL